MTENTNQHTREAGKKAKKIKKEIWKWILRFLQANAISDAAQKNISLDELAPADWNCTVAKTRMAMLCMHTFSVYLFSIAWYYGISILQMPKAICVQMSVLRRYWSNSPYHSVLPEDAGFEKQPSVDPQDSCILSIEIIICSFQKCRIWYLVFDYFGKKSLRLAAA